MRVIPPKDVDHPSAAPRAVEEEEDRTSGFLPTVPILTSPPPSIPEIDSESQHSLREALQSDIAGSSGSHSISSPLRTDRTFREVSSLQRTLAAEAEKQVQSIENDHQLKDNQQDPEENSHEERIERKTLCIQTRDRVHEVIEDPPMQRPRLENPVSAFRWSKADELGHWSPISVPEREKISDETDPEILWQQQVDDHVWQNTGKPICLFDEEWSDLFWEHARQYHCVLEFRSVKGHRLDGDHNDTKRRNSSTFASRIRVATISASNSCGMDRHSGYFCDHHYFTNISKGHTKTIISSNCALQTCVP